MLCTLILKSISCVSPSAIIFVSLSVTRCLLYTYRKLHHNRHSLLIHNSYSHPLSLLHFFTPGLKLTRFRNSSHLLDCLSRTINRTVSSN